MIKTKKTNWEKQNLSDKKKMLAICILSPKDI